MNKAGTVGRGRSRIEPIKKVVRGIRLHQALVLNWFAAKTESSSGILEESNYKITLTIKKAYQSGAELRIGWGT
jgi:hypothetical protein